MFPLPLTKRNDKPPVVIAEMDGYLSRYDKTPTDMTLEYRKSVGDVPLHKMYDGYIATVSCDYIGHEGVLNTEAGQFDIIVYDCAGADGAFDWFSDNNIVAEIDWYLHEQHSSLTGSHASLVLYEN